MHSDNDDMWHQDFFFVWLVELGYFLFCQQPGLDVLHSFPLQRWRSRSIVLFVSGTFWLLYQLSLGSSVYITSDMLIRDLSSLLHPLKQSLDLIMTTLQGPIVM